MDPKEKMESAEHREDRKDSRRDSEEMPVWAADMLKKMDAMGDRMDAMEKGGMVEDRKDSKAEAETEKRQAGELEKLAKEEREEGEREERKDSKKEDCAMDVRKDEDKEEAHKAAEELEARKKEEDRKDKKDSMDKEREDKARADSALARENRELKGRLAAVEAQVSGLYREPSFEDRNALADVRSRADSVYQACTGRPASEPLPGESPIAYRKRMADGLRKFSAKFKAERVDSLSGAAFDIVESQIYADAQAAAKRPDALPRGQLRAIKRNDSGHQVTEYIGDAKAAWDHFTRGASLGVKFTKPTAH